MAVHDLRFTLAELPFKKDMREAEEELRKKVSSNKWCSLKLIKIRSEFLSP